MTTKAAKATAKRAAYQDAAKVAAAVDRLFEARGAEIDRRLKEIFFFSPNGEPTYKSVLLSRMIQEGQKAKGRK